MQAQRDELVQLLKGLGERAVNLQLSVVKESLRRALSLASEIEPTGVEWPEWYVRESSVRHAERETILRMLTDQALAWINKPAKRTALRHVIARIANREHYAELEERMARVRADLPAIAIQEAARVARALFGALGERAGPVRLSEAELADALRAAFERGFEQGWCMGTVTGSAAGPSAEGDEHATP